MSLPPPPPGLFTTAAEGHLQKDMHGKTATGIPGRVGGAARLKARAAKDRRAASRMYSIHDLPPPPPPSKRYGPPDTARHVIGCHSSSDWDSELESDVLAFLAKCSSSPCFRVWQTLLAMP